MQEGLDRDGLTIEAMAKHWDRGPTQGPTQPGRTFPSGATRDDDTGKLDYEGFLSPTALETYAQYMHEHRLQTNGKARGSDNWQKGIPQIEYMKSLWRHLVTAWACHRRGGPPEELTEALCGILFNAFGYLHEMGRARAVSDLDKTGRGWTDAEIVGKVRTASTQEVRATPVGVTEAGDIEWDRRGRASGLD